MYLDPSFAGTGIFVKDEVDEECIFACFSEPTKVGVQIYEFALAAMRVADSVKSFTESILSDQIEVYIELPFLTGQSSVALSMLHALILDRLIESKKVSFIKGIQPSFISYAVKEDNVPWDVPEDTPYRVRNFGKDTDKIRDQMARRWITKLMNEGYKAPNYDELRIMNGVDTQTAILFAYYLEKGRLGEDNLKLIYS